MMIVSKILSMETNWSTYTGYITKDELITNNTSKTKIQIEYKNEFPNFCHDLLTTLITLDGIIKNFEFGDSTVKRLKSLNAYLPIIKEYSHNSYVDSDDQKTINQNMRNIDLDYYWLN